MAKTSKAKSKTTPFKAPSIPKSAMTAALKRNTAAFTKYATFTNIFGMKNEKGLGQYDKGVLVFKRCHVTSPVWKKDVFGTKYCASFSNIKSIIAMLFIPEDTMVVRGSISNWRSDTVKHRAEKAFVVQLYTTTKKVYTPGPKDQITGTHKSNGIVLYTPNTFVVPKKKFVTGDAECASGIHFFRTFYDAKNWR